MKSDTHLSLLKKGGGKREQTKIRNRRIILNAAKQVFARIGYEAATVRDIIHATPLASGTYYNYFKSKEDIYTAIYDDATRTIRAQLHHARCSSQTTEELVTSSVKLYFEYIVQEWKESYQLHKGSGGERARFQAAEVIAAYDELKADLTDAIRRHILPDTDVDLLSATIIGITHEVAGEFLARENFDADAAVKFVSDFILGGIRGLSQNRD